MSRSEEKVTRTHLVWAVALLLSASACAQQPSMPGMTMPKQPQTPEQQRSERKSRKKPDAESEGERQTSMTGMAMGAETSRSPDARSVTRDTLLLQEPEDPVHRTGSNLPAPDFLKEVAKEPAMSLEQFLHLAQEANPTVAQAKDLVRRSAAEARQASLYPNPTVGYQGEQIRGGSYGGGEQGGFVQQTVVLGGKLGLRRKAIEGETRSVEIGLEEQTARVRSGVTQAFYAALAAQARVELRHRLAHLAADAAETAHQLANVGQADAPDILEAEVESEQAKIDFVAAQRAYLKRFQMLADLSGHPELVIAPVSGSIESIPEFDPQKQVGAIVESSPQVRRSLEEVAVREAQLRAARREAVPDIEVRAGEEYNLEHVSDLPVRPVGFQSFATVGVSLPLWNRNQGNVGAAEAEIDRARHEVVRTRLSLRQAAEPLTQTYLTARFTAERYRTELIPRADRAYRLYLEKYQSMAMAYPQVLVSQRTLFQLQIGYLSALEEAWSNAVALQNFTLGGGLEMPGSSRSASTERNGPGRSAGALE